MIDPAWAKVLSDWALFLVGAIATGLAWAWLLIARRGDGQSAQVVALTGRVDGHAQRLATVEAIQASQPGHADLSALTRQVHDGLGRTHARMDDIGASLGRMEGAMAGVQATVARVEVHIMEHGPRAGEHRQ